MEEKNKIETVSQIVQNDYRTSHVFRKYGINYCCGGGSKTLEEACRHQDVNLEHVQGELANATRTVCLPASICFDEWSIDFLIDFIVNIHHTYLKKVLPGLTEDVASFVQEHRSAYTGAEGLQQVVEELSVLLPEHMAKEEESLFPYLRQISNTYKRKETYGRLFVRTLSKPLDQVKKLEHTHILALLTQLRRLTNQYQFAKGDCNEYRVILQKLRELDADLIQHKHLENNFLFPKAMNMEKELLGI